MLFIADTADKVFIISICDEYQLATIHFISSIRKCPPVYTVPYNIG